MMRSCKMLVQNSHTGLGCDASGMQQYSCRWLMCLQMHAYHVERTMLQIIPANMSTFQSKINRCLARLARTAEDQQCIGNIIRYPVTVIAMTASRSKSSDAGWTTTEFWSEMRLVMVFRVPLFATVAESM